MTWWRDVMIVWVCWMFIGWLVIMATDPRKSMSRAQKFALLGIYPLCVLADWIMIVGRWLFVAEEK